MIEGLERIDEATGVLEDVGVVVRSASWRLHSLSREVDGQRKRLDALAGALDEIIIALRVERLSLEHAAPSAAEE